MDVSFGGNLLAYYINSLSKLCMDSSVYSVVVCSNLILIPAELVPITLAVNTITEKTRV